MKLYIEWFSREEKKGNSVVDSKAMAGERNEKNKGKGRCRRCQANIVRFATN
jgi:hypothetical protein